MLIILTLVILNGIDSWAGQIKHSVGRKRNSGEVLMTVEEDDPDRKRQLTELVTHSTFFSLYIVSCQNIQSYVALSFY